MARTSSRSAETRHASARKAETRPMPTNAEKSGLYVPRDIIPPGMTYRWVCISVLNEPNHDNWADRSQAGWKPVPRDRHPDRFPLIPMPGQPENTSNVIMRGNGLVLCERPTKDVLADQRELEKANQELIHSIKFTGQDVANSGGLPAHDFGSQTGIEQVTAMPKDAEFKE